MTDTAIIVIREMPRILIALGPTGLEEKETQFACFRMSDRRGPRWGLDAGKGERSRRNFQRSRHARGRHARRARPTSVSELES